MAPPRDSRFRVRTEVLREPRLGAMPRAARARAARCRPAPAGLLAIDFGEDRDLGAPVEMGPDLRAQFLHVRRLAVEIHRGLIDVGLVEAENRRILNRLVQDVGEGAGLASK